MPLSLDPNAIGRHLTQVVHDLTHREALADAGINIDLISTSEIRISVLIKDTELDKAVAALHEAFELGGDEEAVVYGGTGR